MKYIVKNPEPQDLLDWKAQDRMFQRGRPNYERITGAVKLTLAMSLRAEQGNICCYCERTITVNDCHVEHIKPQGTLYKQFSCDYDNLLCSCQKELAKVDPKHCGMSKGSWYDEALFISPLDPECENKFSYTFDGQILPTDSADQAATTTIFRCQLDISKLQALRKGVIETFTDPIITDAELAAYVENYLIEKEANAGSYNSFYTTIRLLFGHLVANN